ncbi:protein of unknown function [uncultured Woeseiaceae bacterium]|uniref:Uncharacterized protein n=1 Tax=uncultured Woeseiaceae bacterium TaxID=1983305 RepID=A0A7D9H5J0_9GAMM|nr:protein of unknown function [uncultured Woeseiaceae bacterium]
MAGIAIRLRDAFFERVAVVGRGARHIDWIGFRRNTRSADFDGHGDFPADDAVPEFHAGDAVFDGDIHRR